MSIRVVCPNGHALHVKNTLAGKIGLCPMCKARVQIPKLRPDKLNEDAILDILGPPENVPDEADSGIDPSGRHDANSKPARRPHETAQKKNCDICHHEIAVTMHICPNCHTYIAGLQDF